MDLTTHLLEQLTFHWEHQARPRLDGLTDDEYLWEPEGPFAEHPYAALVLHIHREVIHHPAEVALLRDLYRAAHLERERTDVGVAS